MYEYCSPVAMVSVSRHVAHSRQSSSANRNIYFSFNNYNRFLKALSKDLFPSPLFFIHEKNCTRNYLRMERTYRALVVMSKDNPLSLRLRFLF